MVRTHMTAPGRRMAGLYLWLLSATLIAAFNLDTDNVISKGGDAGSLFGFSLAMHWQTHPEDRRLLLVGAPRTKAFPGQKANVTGGLYSCDITSTSRCSRVVFDDSVNLDIESKENQWMGVSVQSQGPGGKVVTCAHRYERRRSVNTAIESRDITGRCYVLSQDLSISDDGMDGEEWNFCEGRRRGHENYGSCQQGVAATFTKDFHYVVFGAPGAFNWKGVVRAEHKNSTLEEMFIFEDGPYETGGETKRDPDLVPVPANSYLGFSLDTGRGITSQSEMTFVAGAPRANHSGAVVLLRKYPPNERQLSSEFIFEGEGLASSFGYDVTVVDLNNDKWQDIVVGAPQFFDKNDKEIGGAVYVYINNAGKWENVKPVRIVGTKNSMFGISVKNVGDVNRDGYPDIAVGAPFDGEFGKVYVYHGAPYGIIEKPAQIIDGKSTNTHSFGYSIAGNMDLDRNSYPDIAVGSLSDSINVFRARPVVSIKKTIKVTPDKIDYNKKNCDAAKSGICVTVEVCFSYTAVPEDYNPVLTIAYQLEVDSLRQSQGLSSRIADFPTPLSNTIELRSQKQNKCFSTSLQLQENIRDKLHHIPVSVTADIKSVRRRRRQSSALPELMPVQNANEPKMATAEVQFLKEGCGEDNICHSNMKVSYRFLSRDGQGPFVELQRENGIPVLALQNQKDIALEVTVTNKPSDPTNPKKDGDDAHEARLVANLPDSLSFSKDLKHQAENNYQCTSNQNGSRVECDLGNPFKRNANVTITLILSATEITVDTNELNIPLTLETTSSQADLGPVVAKARVVVELLLSVSGVAEPSQVYFGGKVTGESAMETEDDIGSPVNFEFRVTNFGRPLKSLGMAFLDLQWPKEIHNGKWLLYIVKIDSKGLDQVTCQPASEINRLRVLESGKSRNRREVGERQPQVGDSSYSLFSERKYLTLDCDKHARCVTIRCPLQGLDSNAVIKVRSRLWNSTFLEEYSKMNYLDILVKAAITMDSTADNIKLSNDAYQVRVTVFPEKTQAQYSGVPWWIIFVSILAGILLLALLVFGLWKCGFFKRNKKDQYDATYHKAEIHTQPSDKERLTSDA